MSSIIIFIITLLIVLGVTLIFAGMSIAAFPKWLGIPGGILALLGATLTFILNSRSGFSSRIDFLFGRNQNEKATQTLQSNEVTIGGDVNGNVLIGNSNILQTTKNIAVTFNYLGGLFSGSQELMQKVANWVNDNDVEKTEKPINIASEKFLGDFQSILNSIERESQHAETVKVMSDLSNTLQPIIDKYKVYTREFNFPYADFCKDFIEALRFSQNITNAFTATPLKTTIFSSGIGDHGKIGIHLRILSKLLPFSPSYGDYYLSVNSDRYDKPVKIDKIWLCALGIDAWGEMPRKQENIDDGTSSINGRLERLKFNDRLITVEDFGYRTNHIYEDPNYPYHLRLDLQKFSSFVIGLVSDFIILSSDSIEYDENFNRKMKDLFGKLDLKW